MRKRSDSGKGLTIYRAREPEFLKLLWRLLGKLPAKLGALGGVPGEPQQFSGIRARGPVDGWGNGKAGGDLGHQCWEGT